MLRILMLSVGYVSPGCEAAMKELSRVDLSSLLGAFR